MRHAAASPFSFSPHAPMPARRAAPAGEPVAPPPATRTARRLIRNRSAASHMCHTCHTLCRAFRRAAAAPASHQDGPPAYTMMEKRRH